MRWATGGRIHRQQLLIKSVLTHAFRLENIGGIQKAARAFLSDITVVEYPDSPRHPPKIGFDQLMSLTGFLSRLTEDQERFYEIPTVQLWWHGQDCLRPNYAGTRIVFKEAFRDDATAGWESEKEEDPLAPSSTVKTETAVRSRRIEGAYNRYGA